MIGKSIGGGIPSGAYGLTREVADAACSRDPDADLVDVGGVGGTLAGNALSVAAMRATLEHVLTEPAFERMIDLADRRSPPASRRPSTAPACRGRVSQLGARAEYRFASPAPRDRSASPRRPATTSSTSTCTCTWPTAGVLITPFHNMALMCPDTSAADVDLHTRLFEHRRRGADRDKMTHTTCHTAA